MPIILSAPGTVEPLATVAVKPRVDGQIVEVGFAEGDLVTEGQVLFRLDNRLATAQIQQAEANIAKDEAALRAAESVLARREVLVQKKIVSEENTETAKQAVDVLKATINASRALRDGQRTQLDYLTIRAPITGRTGTINAKLGATVRGGDTTQLVTINQTKPIAIGFALPQSDLAALKQALAAKSKAEIVIPGTAPIKAAAIISMVENQVDKQTGTVLAKAVAENAGETLWPGQAVEVALTVEVKLNVVAVPASAVLPSQDGMLVWVVGADNKVSTRKVMLDRIVKQTAFLADGLKAGEQVVTDGQIRLAPGGAVAIREPRGNAAPTAPASTPAESARSPAPVSERRTGGRS